MTTVTVLSAACALLLLGCFVAFAAASYRHFAQGIDSRGNAVIRALSLLGTAVMLVQIWLAMPVPPAFSAVGLFLGIASLVMFRAALNSVQPGELHVAFTGDGPERLVTSGIYGRIRNPLYTSYLMYWAAWVPATGLHPISVACFALFLSLYWIAVREEERFLAQRFGDAYHAFKLRTGRFLPRIHALRS